MRRLQRNGGFTLVELLVVLALLALLASLLIPAVLHGVELTRKVDCQGKLRHLGQLFHVLGREEGTGSTAHRGVRLPFPYHWDRQVHDRGYGHYLRCPSVLTRGLSMSASLMDMYIRQIGDADSVTPGLAITNMYDMLIDGKVNDPQVHYWYQDRDNGPAEGGWGWVLDLNGGQEPEDNQAFVTIATCAAVLFTFTSEYIEITPLGHSPSWYSGSHHWVCQGDPSDGTEDDILVRLTGRGYPTVNPPVQTSAIPESDYGLSNQHTSTQFHPDQLFGVEYSKPTVHMPGSDYALDQDWHEPFDGDLGNGEVMDRHLGDVNLLWAGGGVRCMTKGELEQEYQRFLADQSSLWKR